VAKKPIHVSQLNAYIGRLLSADSNLSDICVTGEISNFKLHGSGHVFFSLKDDRARVNCFLPSGIFRRLGFELHDGLQTVCEGYVNVFEKNGAYSLNIRALRPEGQGSLAEAFEAVKKKLAAKGYFDEGHKKALPAFPRNIAIVTSNTGAAVEDMVKIITARNSVCNIRVFPTLVQGGAAAEMIASRIRQVNAGFPDTDVLIVGRGGGAAEDLWAFNEETVADAVFASRIPVISAVGHETDFTICDFVADLRAETPTAAAQMAAPDTGELIEDLDVLRSVLKDGMMSRLVFADMRIRANNVDGLHARLDRRIQIRAAETNAIRAEMTVAVRKKASEKFCGAIDALLVSMRAAMERQLRDAGGERMEIAGTGMRARMERRMATETHRAAICGERLEMLSPLKVLTRGYAIVEDRNGRAVQAAAVLKSGDEVGLRFADGTTPAVVGTFGGGK
jgi:exodeoxyribonuclease VII large subunit